MNEKSKLVKLLLCLKNRPHLYSQWSDFYIVLFTSCFFDPMQSNSRLKQELLELGYSETTVNIALRNSPDKSINGLTNYILQYELSQVELQRRKVMADISKESEDKNNETNTEIFRRCRKEWNDARLYHESIKARIANERNEFRASQENLVAAVPKADNVAVLEDDCQIRVRFSKGFSEVFVLNKSEPLSKLFDAIKSKSKSFKVYTPDHRKLERSSASLDECGLYPFGILFVKTK